MDNNYFIYDNNIYNQIFGMPMGNPLSPTIADIVLDNLLDDAIIELNNKGIYIKYIVKYVDDILAIVNHDDINVILNTFNHHHPKIKFTVEIEEHRKIAFLDTKLHRLPDGIIFDWYSKETASGRLMNFNSTQPRSQIINTAKNFIERVLKISDQSFHNKNIQKINQILKENSFPQNLINNLINDTNRRFENSSQLGNTEDKRFFSVHYIPGLTDTRQLRTTIDQQNICFSYKPNTTLSSLFTNIKTPIEKQQQNNVIYEVQCKGNDKEQCNLIYIGTTKRALGIRISEHKKDIEKMTDSTGLSRHIISSRHSADFDGVKIIDKESKERKRYTKESLHIQKNINRTCNLKEDTNNINSSYIVAIK